MNKIKLIKKNIINKKYYDELLKYTKQLTESSTTNHNHILERIHSWLEEKSFYQLLAYISTLFNNISIIELGTRYGLSALSLSYNSTNKIISYDIIDEGQFNIIKNNLTYNIENIINDEKIDNLLFAQVIFIDIDPHDGKNEKIIIDFLEKNNYKGIVIMDDIYFEGLYDVWKNIKATKYDLSNIKECDTGIGIIDYQNILEVI